MNRNVRIALIQMDCEFGNKEKNLSRAISFLKAAAKQGAEIICLPECFNTGYSVDRVDKMADMAETLDGHTLQIMSMLAKQLGIFLIVPLILKNGQGRSHNAAVLIDDQGNVNGVYTKNHLIGGEIEWLDPGTGYPVFTTKYGTIGILICYDMAHPETARILAEKGAELIFVPSAWRDKRKFMHGFNTNLVCRAIDNVLFMAGANRCGIIDEVHFGGNSQIVDPEGTILACNGIDETIVITDIDLCRVAEERLTNSVLRDSRNEDFAWLVENYKNKHSGDMSRTF